MDISFHYFAVKTVARAAGYDEQKAQRIAEFSQFIDDFNWYKCRCAGNVPDYIKAPYLDIVVNKIKDTTLINPVTTGFSDWFDMATLILDRSQRFTVSPFHFIPQDEPSVRASDRKTVPATIDDGSYISTELRELQNKILEGGISESDSLMKMGMLLHTFADTYAHQLFTGFLDKVNSVKLTIVTDNVTGEDVTGKYHFWVEQWIAKAEKLIKKKLPTIGHMAIAHIPDLSHLSFEMEYQRYDGTVCNHVRSNAVAFITACRQIYDYMRGILGDEHPADMSWDELSGKLADSFLIDASKELDENETAAVQKLTSHWASIFPNYNFSYNSERIKSGFVTSVSDDVRTVTIDGVEQSFITENYSDDFYKFNYFADLHLINLYGAHPRKLLPIDNELAQTADL